MISDFKEKNYSLPRQKLPRSEKTEEWGIQNVDYIMQSCSYNSLGAGSVNDYQRMKINYDLYNDMINKEDFTYVTNPYGLKEEFPARLYNYNIITPKLKLLEGEEIKRPFNFRCVAINEDAVSEIEEKRKDLLMRYLEAELEKSLMERGINVQNPQTGEVMTPAQIQKYMNHSESDIREITANHLANYLIKKETMEFKFNKGFKDALIAAKEIYYVGIDNDEPICEVVNPLDFGCDKDSDADFFQDGQRAWHTKYATIASIIDAYYSDLTDAEIEYLDSEISANPFHTKMLQGDASGPIIPINYNMSNLSNNQNYNGHIPVTKVEWKSLRKIGFLKFYDESFKEQETIVDESYVVQKKKGETIEWAWINEVWEGTRIGKDIYVRIQPKILQYRSIDNPSLCKLGYVGAIYNDRNAQATSLVDLVKHHQYLYNIIMYRMELEIAKAKGKKMVMDIAQIPHSQGIDLEKWMYYFDTIGIAFVNSFEEGKGKFQGQTSNFNQFTAVDMSLSQAVGQYIMILDKIETMAADLIGVSRQRQGAISSSETVGGVERSVQQSSHITEPLFYLHNEIKKHVLTQLIECAKIAYPEGKKINYILDDMERVFLQIDEHFVNADYGIFVTNSAKEVKALEDLKGVAMQAISAGMISLKEAVTIFESNSMAQVKHVIDDAETKKQNEQQQEYQAQQDLQKQQLDAQAQMMDHEADRLDKRVVIKGEIDKELAYIKTFGGINASPEDDANSDGIPDVLEYEKLVQDAKQHNDKMKLEDKKLALEQERTKSTERIAEKKIAVDKIKARKPTSSK